MTYYSESQKRASRKFNENAYDRLYITIPKGQKDQIRQIAESGGISINGFIKEAIEEKINRRQ